jgi:hypothetical protein
MIESGSSQSLVYTIANNNLLSNENIAPSTTIEAILQDYEISLSHGKSKVDTKIKTELKIIEIELENAFDTTLRQLRDFIDEIAKLAPKEGTTASSEEYDIKNIEQLIQMLLKIKNLHDTAKQNSLELIGILRTGGYRSLCICLLESLQKIRVILDDRGKSQHSRFVSK